MKPFIYTPGDKACHKKLGRELEQLPKDKGDYIITVKRNRPIRSLSANRYYHAIINIIAIDTGHTHEQLHDYCKQHFAPMESIVFELKNMSEQQIADLVARKLNPPETVIRSTKDMNSTEFATYINKIKMWAAERLGILIPEAKDIDYKKWLEIETEYEKVTSGF